MTKAEKAIVHELRLRAALLPPTFARPTPLNVSEKTYGWFMNSYTGEVTYGCSWVDSHKLNITSMGCGSQGQGTIFATRDDALKAMRWEAYDKAAHSMLRLDDQIEAIRDTPVDEDALRAQEKTMW